MKKFALPGMIILSLIASTANAQLSASKEAEILSSESASNVALTKANYKALKSFKKNHADGSDVSWFIGVKTITASMNRDGKKINVVYDRNGRWLRDERVYGENLLDSKVRSEVKRIYFGHKITQVQEFREGEITFYIIHLEDATSFLKLAYCDGQMNVHQQFKKQL